MCLTAFRARARWANGVLQTRSCLAEAPAYHCNAGLLSRPTLRCRSAQQTDTEMPVCSADRYEDRGLLSRPSSSGGLVTRPSFYYGLQSRPSSNSGLLSRPALSAGLLSRPTLRWRSAQQTAISLPVC